VTAEIAEIADVGAWESGRAGTGSQIQGYLADIG
jgi:hypothetical protein